MREATVRVRDLFLRARSASPSERDRILGEESSAPYRSLVERLLDADQAADAESFLGSSPNASAAPIEDPERLGRFTVLRRLGQGGMGVVYLACDPQQGRQVALKVLLDGVVSPRTISSLRCEAANVATCMHPGIARILDYNMDGDVPFIVMEYVAGETLAERLRRGPLGVRESIDVGWQIAAALRHAHGAGLVHGDLKPANIIIEPEGVVKLLDFGIAYVLPRVSEGDATDPALAVAGTPGYMSPDLLSGSPPDTTSDVFALGCVLFECLAGEPAFSGDGVLERIRATMQLEPDLSRLPAKTHASVVEFLSRALGLGDARPVNMAEASDRLERLARPSGRGRRRAGDVVGLVAVVTTVAVVIATISTAGHGVDGMAVHGTLWGRVRTWQHTHSSPVFVSIEDHTAWPGTVVYGLDVGSSDGGDLFACDLLTGRVAWRASPDIQQVAAVFGDEYATQGGHKCRRLEWADLDGDGSPELLAEYAHGLKAPAHVATFDRTGRRIGTYYNPGLLYDIAVDDLDGDGGEEVIVGGTNNFYNTATVFILDQAHLTGAAVDARYRPECTFRDSAAVRILFPRFQERFMDLLQIERLVATDVVVERGPDGDMKIRCSVGSEDAPLFVWLDASLWPLDYDPSAIPARTPDWSAADRDSFLASLDDWLAGVRRVNLETAIGEQREARP